MSGDFEKNISHHLEGFQLNPHPQVWERVAAALPEKRRRRFAIWWLLPLAACLGGGVWLMVNQQKGTTNKQNTDSAHKTAVNNNHFKEIIHPLIDTAGVDILEPDDAQKVAVNENSNNVHHKRNGAKKESATGYPVNVSKPSLQTNTIAGTHQKKIPIYENALLKRHSGTSATQTEDMMYVLNPAVGNAAVQKAKNNDSVSLNKELIFPLMDTAIIPLPETIAKNDTAITKKTDTVPQNLVEIKAPKAKNKNRRVEWNLLIGVGKSNLANSSSDMDKSLAASYSNSVGQTNTGGQTNNTGGVFNNPTAGFNGSAGFMRRQTISNHISWQAEVSYQFLTAKQRVGSRNDSLARLDASANIAFYRTNRTANDQRTTIQSNRVQRLQITPGFLYTLNPQARSPFCFFAGVAVAYTTSNHLLLHDYNSGSYIQSAKLSNKWMFGGEAGMNVFINHTIQAGLFYQHDFTNVAKAKAGSVLRWNQWQLRIGISLSKYK